MSLTPKQELFVQEYLVDLNATQAAIRAGYSEQTARQTASENLSIAAGPLPGVQVMKRTFVRATTFGG